MAIGKAAEQDLSFEAHSIQDLETLSGIELLWDVRCEAMRQRSEASLRQRGSEASVDGRLASSKRVSPTGEHSRVACKRVSVERHGDAYIERVEVRGSGRDAYQVERYGRMGKMPTCVVVGQSYVHI